MTKTLLVDGDMLAWRMAAGACETIDWGDGEPFALTLPIGVVNGRVKGWLDAQMRATHCGGYRIYLSAPTHTYFRHAVDSTYKQNRIQKPKPTNLGDVLCLLDQRYGATWVDNLEADDLLGINATGLFKDTSVICSVDKDLLQIPGIHWNPVKLELNDVGYIDGQVTFYKQVLTGDVIDNFKGCPGVGPVKAEKILGPILKSYEPKMNGCGKFLYRLWEATRDTFLSRGFTEDYAIQQARLAHILTYDDFNNSAGGVPLWNPPANV